MGADEFMVEGHIPCERCDAWIVDVPGRTTKLCGGCSSDLGKLADAVRFAYEVDGERFTAPPPPTPKKRKQPFRSMDSRGRERMRAHDRARSRALFRLARVYRPMFEVLLNEEKLREGLDPTSTTPLPAATATADELLADIAEAQEREAERARRLAEGR